MAHGLSYSAACGIFPDQDSNPCPLHWQADSKPLHHQGSPREAAFDPGINQKEKNKTKQNKTEEQNPHLPPQNFSYLNWDV